MKTKTVSITPQVQHTLFRCQLWHVRKARELLKTLKAFERTGRDHSFVRHLRRQLKQHGDFIASMTPFVTP